MRIAIGQLAMHWDGDANTRAVCDAIARAGREGCTIALFAELALTGFHRRVPEQAQPERVAGWLAQVQAACAAHGVTAGVGLPAFDGAGGILNRYAFVDAAGGVVGWVDKSGLTEPEATYFVRGSGRPVHTLAGHAWSSVIRREIEDEIAFDGGAPAFIAWPGFMGPQPHEAHIDPPSHVLQAQALAARHRAWVVQANWPQSLNRPELSVHTGRSAVIAPDGTLVFRLPPAEPGIGLFAPGDAAPAWIPQPASA